MTQHIDAIAAATKKLSSTVILFSIVFLIAPIYLIAGTAQAQFVCPEHALRQITNETQGISRAPSINEAGNIIAFTSDADINGINSDGNEEIYLFDNGTNIFTQITDEPSGDSREPSINAAGNRIVFSSRADIVGPNPDMNAEIYLLDTGSGTFTRITDSPQASGDPSINAAGDKIAFSSSADINGVNTGGNREIYIFNTASGIFTMITDTPSGSSVAPSINAAGDKVAFTSDADINGVNIGGNDEIYLFDTVSGTFTQITNSSINPPEGDSSRPSINAAGDRVAFMSRTDINGFNIGGNREIYLYDAESGVITQITDEPSGESMAPSINAEGNIVAFSSNANINGGNPDENSEIFVFDAASGTITQVTSDPLGDARDPSVNAAGNLISYWSPDSEMANTNREIFLAFCFDPLTARNIPTLSEWGLIATAAFLGVIGLIAIRRRATL